MAGLVPLPIVSPPGGYPTLPLVALSADFVFTTPDGTSNTFVSTGREVLIASGLASGGNVTIKSQPDALGRSGDITTYACGAGLFSIFGPFPMAGWADTGGLITVICTGTVKVAVVRLPSLP